MFHLVSSFGVWSSMKNTLQIKIGKILSDLSHFSCLKWHPAPILVFCQMWNKWINKWIKKSRSFISTLPYDIYIKWQEWKIEGWLGAYLLMVDQWIGIRLLNGLVLATEKPLSKPLCHMSCYTVFIMSMSAFYALWLADDQFSYIMYLSKYLKLMYGSGGSVDSPMSSWVLSLCNAGRLCTAWATVLWFGVVIKHTHGAARVVCLYTGGCGCPMQLPR